MSLHIVSLSFARRCDLDGARFAVVQVSERVSGSFAVHVIDGAPDNRTALELAQRLASKHGIADYQVVEVKRT